MQATSNVRSTSPLHSFGISTGDRRGNDVGVVCLSDILRNLDAEQIPGAWVYAELPLGSTPPACSIATVLEEESLTVILTEENARNLGLEWNFKAAWITLRVHSALDAIGLIARISGHLAAEGIACNVIAGARHDHLLVPFERASEAISVLNDMQRSASELFS